MAHLLLYWLTVCFPMCGSGGIGMTEEEIDRINASISEYDENFGYGVRNVHKRIELLFGKGYGLYYKMNKEGGVTVEITLPAGKQKTEGEDHV